MLVDEAGKLTGLFTDSDLARLFERRDEAALDRPIAELMVSEPTTIETGARMSEALRVLSEHKYSELPVVDPAGRPLGLIDVTDVVALDPSEDDDAQPTVRLFPGEQADVAG